MVLPHIQAELFPWSLRLHPHDVDLPRDQPALRTQASGLDGHIPDAAVLWAVLRGAGTGRG